MIMESAAINLSEVKVTLMEEREFIKVGDKQIEVLERVFDPNDGIYELYAIGYDLLMFTNRQMMVDGENVRTCSLMRSMDDYLLMVGIYDWKSKLWDIKVGKKEFRTTTPFESTIRQMED